MEGSTFKKCKIHFIFSRECSSVLKDLALYGGFGGCCGVEPTALNQGGDVTGRFLTSCCEWPSSHSKWAHIECGVKDTLEMSLMAEVSTRFQMTTLLVALSLGTPWVRLVQRVGCTRPRTFLARPRFLLFLVVLEVRNREGNISEQGP